VLRAEVVMVLIVAVVPLGVAAAEVVEVERDRKYAEGDADEFLPPFGDGVSFAAAPELVEEGDRGDSRYEELRHVHRARLVRDETRQKDEVGDGDGANCEIGGKGGDRSLRHAFPFAMPLHATRAGVEPVRFPTGLAAREYATTRRPTSNGCVATAVCGAPG